MTKRKSTQPEQPFVSGSALTWKVKYIKVVEMIGN